MSQTVDRELHVVIISERSVFAAYRRASREMAAQGTPVTARLRRSKSDGGFRVLLGPASGSDIADLRRRVEEIRGGR